MCLYPVSIKTKDAFGLDVNQSVPCGKCIECLKDKQNSWKIRLCEEFKCHLFAYFFTLTYSESSVPFVYDDDGDKHLTLRKSDVQLWIKRHRMAFTRKLGKDVDLKYFICGEYGPNTGRPHYHGIIFTELSPSLFGIMMNDWSSLFGFVNWSQVAKKKEEQVQSVTMLLSIVLSQPCLGLPLKKIYTDFPKLAYYKDHSI